MSSKRCAIPFSVLLTAVLLLPAGGNSSGRANTATVRGQDPTSATAAGRLMIIENAGQWPDAARFQVWGGGQTLWLAEDAIWLTAVERADVSTLERFEPERANTQHENVQRVNVKLSFPGANPHPRLESFDRLDTHVSYFIGADPEKWRPDVPVWGGVRYRDLYPGVDLVVGAGLAPTLDGERPQGSPLQWHLEGMDLNAVRLRVEGADAVAVDGVALRLRTAAGELTLPLLMTEGRQVEGSGVEHLNTQAFDVAAPLVSARINPQSQLPNTAGTAARNPQSAADNPADLLYGTFLGGRYFDYGNGIAVDAAGGAYVTGYTGSADFPATPGTFNTNYDGSDAFVVKLNRVGNALAYATFLGGTRHDWGSAIALDGAGSAYVTGYTESPDFPVTPGAFDTSYNGPEDAFEAKLDPDGRALAYATYLGGSWYDFGYATAVDAAGSAYVTGRTESADFPVTPGAFDTSYNGGIDYGDAFAVKLNPAGSGLLYSTYLGGGNEDHGSAIAVGKAGSAYVTGWTWSGGFPTTPGAFDTSYNGGYWGDAFVVKLNPAGSALRYGTFLGGGDTDGSSGIAVDAAGNAYVTGRTESADFPVTPGAFDTSYTFSDAFVAKLNPAGSGLAYATFLGGSSGEGGNAIAVNAAGSAYVTGYTLSADFPVTLGAFDTSYNGDKDAFVVKLNRVGNALAYATFLGGTRHDWGNAITVDAACSAYLIGWTDSSNFPATPGTLDTSYNGDWDAFVAKLSPPCPLAILGTIWYDLDGDGLQGAGEPGLVGIVVKLFRYGLQIGQTTTSGDGTYRFASLEADAYTVRERQPAWLRWSTTPDEVTVVLAAGETRTVDFGDWSGRRTCLPLILR